MKWRQTLLIAALSGVLTQGIVPPALAHGSISFGIHFGHDHRHHFKPHKHYRLHPRHRYRRYPGPYFRYDYFYPLDPYFGYYQPWPYRPYRLRPRYKDCYYVYGRRKCRWVYD